MGEAYAEPAAESRYERPLEVIEGGREPYRPRSVLFVGNDSYETHNAMKALEAHGVTAKRTTSADIALSQFRFEEPDAVILGDGYEGLAAVARRASPKAFVAVVTNEPTGGPVPGANIRVLLGPNGSLGDYVMTSFGDATVEGPLFEHYREDRMVQKLRAEREPLDRKIKTIEETMNLDTSITTEIPDGN